MKTGIVIRIKYSSLFLVVLFSFVIQTKSLCLNTGPGGISIDTSYGYPVINIKNISGRIITIKPVSKETGSIGFEKNGNIIWLKGMPEIKNSGNISFDYIWKISNDQTAVLEANKVNEDINFKFSVSAEGKEPATKWILNLGADEDEYFTGAMERVIDGSQFLSWKKGLTTALNLRGEKVGIKLKPTASAYAPFYISSKDYGLFVKGTWPGIFDFCKQYPDIVHIEFEGPLLNIKLYLDSTPMKIVSRHAQDSGPSFIPPSWVFGPWRWRDELKNNKKYWDSTEVKAPFNSELVEDILMMKAYGIPCTAYWIDRPWGNDGYGFDDYDFDRKRFPHPEQMIKWINKNGSELMMWIGPFVMDHMADYAESKKYFLDSKPRVKFKQVLMDFSNPEACKWWEKNGPGKLAEMGIRGFKLDRADGEKLMDTLGLKTFAGETYRENFNDYPVQYIRATYDAVKPAAGNNFFLFSRAQYTGSAKYGGMWAGDTYGGPEGLRSVIIGMQRCAVMGYPVWGSDIGGWGKNKHEILMRWLAFGCFSPIMEVGPTNNRGFWNNLNEPEYDTALIATWRLYAKIRMKLIPYLETLAVEANKTGEPIIRPLFLEYPDQNESWKNWQTFIVGKDILVTAIWQLGIRKQKVYLPAGEQWIDAWDRTKIYNGGQYVGVLVPDYKIPVFIRKGSRINLGDLNSLYKKSMKIAARKPDMQLLERSEGWK